MDASRSDLYTGGERLTCSLEIQPKLKHDVAVPPRPRRLDSSRTVCYACILAAYPLQSHVIICPTSTEYEVL